MSEWIDNNREHRTDDHHRGEGDEDLLVAGLDINIAEQIANSPVATEQNARSYPNQTESI